MDQIQHQARNRPSVFITTYSNHQNLRKNSQSINAQSEQENSATNSELVTDLFNKTKSKFQNSRFKLQLDLSQIKGPTGTIRGHKDVVKKSLENIRIASKWSRVLPSNHSHQSPPSLTSFLGQPTNQNHPPVSGAHSISSSPSSFGSLTILSTMDKNYRIDYLNRLSEEEFGQCVVYTTTLGVIRRTFEDSKQMRSLLNLNLIKYEERDIYLNQEYTLQLKLRCNSILVPVLFVDGEFLGGIKELELLNENGQLSSKLSKFKMREILNSTCACCGNAKFIACQNCHGSRKSTIHHFKFNSVALRCIVCYRNDGLVQCPACLSSSDDSKGEKDGIDLNNNSISSVNCEKLDKDSKC